MGLLEEAKNNKIFLNILFSLTQTGYSNFRKLNYRMLADDMSELLNKIYEDIYKK